MRNPVLLSFAVLFFGASCSTSPSSIPVAGVEARQLLLNRNWIDRLPTTRKDTLQVFRFVPAMGGGVFQDRTIFAGTFELFAFEATDDKVRFNLLHTEEKRTVDYRIERITPKRKGDFDLKLTFAKSPRGGSVYYGWSREGAAQQSAELDGDLDAAFAAAP